MSFRRTIQEEISEPTINESTLQVGGPLKRDASREDLVSRHISSLVPADYLVHDAISQNKYLRSLFCFDEGFFARKLTAPEERIPPSRTYFLKDGIRRIKKRKDVDDSQSMVTNTATKLPETGQNKQQLPKPTLTEADMV